MNGLLKPAPVFAVFLAIVLLFFGQYALAGICLLAGIASLGIGSFRETSEMRGEDVADSLDAESRSLLIPIKRLSSEISDLVAKNSASPVVRAIGPDLEAESARIRVQAQNALQARSEIKKSLGGFNGLSNDVIREDISPIPSESLGSGVVRTTAEFDRSKATLERQQASAEAALEAISKIDASLREAKNVLSEIRGRLAAETTGIGRATDAPDVLRESVSRLRVIGASFDEANELTNR